MNSADQLNADIDRLLRERKALRKQVAALKAAKLRYCPSSDHAVAEKAPFGVLVVRSFAILYANQACCEMFGCSSADHLQGKDVLSFVATSNWPEAAQLIQSITPEALTTPLNRELVGRRLDGTEFPLALTIVNISWNSDPAFLCYLFDIQAKKSHEISSMKSTARRRLLRDMANISVWDWNRLTDSLEVDTVILHSLGIGRSLQGRPLLGKLMVKIYQQDRAHVRRSIFAGLRTGTLETAPFRYFDRDGKVHWAELHGRFLSEQHPPDGMVGILRDITTNYSATQALTQAQCAAQSADLAKHRFISNISHELRTPLNGILGMLQLMQQEAHTDEFRRYLSMATLSGKNLLQVINDILELTEATESTSAVRAASFSPYDLLVSICDNFCKEAEDKNIALRTAILVPSNSYYVGDYEKLSQIVRNVLANSMKFTSQGSVEIDARIILRNTERHRLLVTVTDTGIGIPDAYQTEVFKPFAQADGTASRRYQGAGLGLGIVRKHIDRLGGTLSISSEENIGTSICFTLDLRPEVAPSPLQTGTQPSTKSLKILLAEDNPVNQVLAETVLQQMGYEVRPVHNGKEVLKALEEDEFGCILMDIQMPEMSGIEATRRIRSSGAKYSQVPIIALTAHTLQGDRKRILESGITSYLAKPISITELKKAMLNILREKL